MGEPKHTPGPWHFDGDWLRIPAILDANGAPIASVEKSRTVGKWSRDMPEREANARLIAAAPELLAAAKAALAFNDALARPHEEGEAAILDSLQAAIAKADPAGGSNG